MINDEYDPKYAKALLGGARNGAVTPIQFCLKVGILYSDYRKWIKEFPEFKKAAEWGDMQYAAYWEELYRANCEAEKPALSLIQYATKNVPLINWVDKKEEFREPEDPPREIRITVLPPRAKPKEEEDNASNI